MKGKNVILKWTIIGGCVLVMQTSTFYLISPGQLETRLLPEYFQFAHNSDSAYVRDFIEPSEDPPLATIISHNLRDHSNLLKEKLNVKFILFGPHNLQSDPREKDFSLVYYTWIERGDWLSLSNFYKLKQVEQIVIDKKTIYRREVMYQWCLFFWTESSEFIQSGELK